MARFIYRNGGFCNTFLSLLLRRLSLCTRTLHTSSRRWTDGVYRDLTNMRVKTPWIEALRKQSEEPGFPSTEKKGSSSLPNRDLKTKKMSDSFHRVVGKSLYSFRVDLLTDIEIDNTTSSGSLAW